MFYCNLLVSFVGKARLSFVENVQSNDHNISAMTTPFFRHVILNQSFCIGLHIKRRLFLKAGNDVCLDFRFPNVKRTFVPIDFRL